MGEKEHTHSEEELITLLRNRDRQAAAILYDSYSAALFGNIRRIITEQESAEDVLQEAFVKIWNNFHTYDEKKGRLFTWMLNISRNLAIDKTRSLAFKNSGKNRDIENLVHVVDRHESSSTKIESIGLRKIVEQLKQDQQQIIELVYFQGYTQVEVSETLMIPLGTVKTRLRTAMGVLRKYFN